MTETITGLKDNRMKTGVAASAVVTEHTIRMKKTLGSLNTRNLKASEPLQVTLDDIHNSDKRGKWWLVSASWRDEGITARGQESNTSRAADEGHSDSDKSLALASDDDNLNDLHSLATNHRMNTTIRRAIFTTLLSSTDCKDAQQRLLKLHLTRSQERQIPSVLLHCAGAEEAYNPFYTLVARRLCKEHKLRMGFQFAAWDLFRKMGEIGDDCDDDDEDDEDEDEGGNRMSLPSVVNHARMYADLIGRDCVSITIFKVRLPSTLPGPPHLHKHLRSRLIHISEPRSHPPQAQDARLRRSTTCDALDAVYKGEDPRHHRPREDSDDLRPCPRSS